MRAFIAFDFDAGEAIRRLLRELQSAKARVRVVPPENLHVTLKFLGDVNEGLVPSIVAVMEDAVRGARPGTVALVGTGAFPSLKAPRVLWVGLRGGESLGDVARKLEDGLAGLGFPREKRSFSPHLTVGRVKGPKGREALVKVMEAHREEAFGEQKVDEIRLKRSELTPKGAIYSNVASVSLA